MEKYYLQTLGIPVLSHGGDKLGRIADVLVNTDSGRVVGFFLVSGKVISPIDVLDWDNYIVIEGKNEILEVEDIHQVIEVISKKNTIYRKKVFTKSGDYIGKVINFGIDKDYYLLTCLITAKSFLGSIFWDKHMIPAQDIIEIRKKKIIVKDLVKPVKMKKLKVDMAAEYGN